MGARQSKRSVDITTTPKKGEDIVTEGEGKLEKIGDADVKPMATNGAVPHNNIEVGEKEDSAPAEKDAKKEAPEVKENGVPEETEPKTPNTDTANESTSSPNETTSESAVANDSKVEETPDPKKSKEKKKKKWSFRSISFSKKDKSKPGKENDNKNDAEVKEVAEENADQTPTSPNSVESKTEEAKTTEQPIANGEASTEEISKPACEETAKPAEEAQKLAEATTDKAPAEETPNSAEEVPKTQEPEAEKAETEEVTAFAKIEKVEESSKEVRSNDDVPPPLPASNPPNPVMVFAESTKADALLLPSESAVQSEATISGSNIAKIETSLSTEPEPTQKDLEISASTDTSSVVPKDETQKTDDEKVNVKDAENLLTDTEISKHFPGSQDAPEIPQEKLSELEIAAKLVESVLEPPTESQKPSEMDITCEPPVELENTSSLPVDESLSESEILPPKIDIVSETTLSSESSTIPLKSEDLPKIDILPSLETSSISSEIQEDISKVIEISNTIEIPDSKIISENLDPSETSSEPSKSTVDEVIPPSPSEDLDNSVTQEQPDVHQQSSIENSQQAEENVKCVEESTKIPEASESSLPISPPSSPLVIQEEIPVNADSLPDISTTESLPSLPDPISENLAEPMSLPPVDSVPEPIAIPDEGCPASTIVNYPISDLPIPLTSETSNNVTNGLPSPTPTDEVSSAQAHIEGSLKQIPIETTEVRQEGSGDKPSDAIAEQTVKAEE